MFRQHNPDLIDSQLFDETTFYKAFLKDLYRCRSELIIESPFITTKRMSALFPILEKLRKRGVQIVINTRHPDEHEDNYRLQAEEAIARLQSMGVLVLCTGRHHRKVVLLDRNILWEGSLNVLSQHETCEMMRRISSAVLAQQMIRFLRIQQYLVQ